MSFKVIEVGINRKPACDFLLVINSIGLGLTDILSFSLCRTANALRTKIDRKSAISLQRGHFDPKFKVEGDVSHQ